MNPFASAAFLECWWSSMGDRVCPATEITNHPALARAFLARKALGFARVVEPAGRGSADYTDLDWTAVSSEDFREFLRGFFLDSRADLLVLPRVVGGGRLESVLRSCALEMGAPIFRFRYDVAPFVSLDGNWETFYGRKKAKTRYTLRRKERKLQQMGELRILHVTTTVGLEDGLDRAFRLYARRSETQFRRSQWLTPRGRRMIRAFALRLAESGALDLTFLLVGEHPLAFSFGFRHQDTYFLWATAFDPDPTYRAYSPGLILVKHLLERAFASGLRRFDFMVGAEDYKWIWATGYDEIFTYVLGGKRLRSRGSFGLYCLSLATRQRLRKVRKLRELLVHLRHLSRREGESLEASREILASVY